MTNETIIQDLLNRIRGHFAAHGNSLELDKNKGQQVRYDMKKEGVEVTNLSESMHRNFLPWGVFYYSLELLLEQGGSASKGDAMNAKFGDAKLSVNSIEGRVAARIYGVQEGESVFRRITPISDILIEAGICTNNNGVLTLV